MTLINGKVVLLIGGTRLINDAVVRHFLEKGVGQVRAYSGDEDGLTALRDRLQEVDATAAARVKYYVGDVVEPSYFDEAMAGVDFVLFAPTIKSERECDEDPTDACTALLGPVNTVMQIAIRQKVRKLVVLGQPYDEPLSDSRSLIAALLEKVVVTEARHQRDEDDTSICYFRTKEDVVPELVNTFFA